MARAKLRCIMGCPGLQSSYQEKSLLSTSLFFYKLLLKIIKIDVKVNKTLKLKFMLMLFDRVYPRRPSDTVTKYTVSSYLIGGKIIQMVLGLILLIYCMVSKTWLKNALHFTSWNRIFARVCFYKSSFFIPSFRHQDSNSYYLMIATAKIPKVWKRKSLDVFFLICKSQDHVINRQWLFNWNLLIVYPTPFFNFVIGPWAHNITARVLCTSSWIYKKIWTCSKYATLDSCW